MKFKYKTSFCNEIKASSENLHDSEFYSKASLEGLKNLVSEEIDFERNIDLMGVAFNAAIVNRFNKNDDGIDTNTALAIKDYFVHKPANIEHNKSNIVGHIISSGFSNIHNDELMEEVNGENLAPFNLCLGAVVYSAANREFANLVMDSVDPENEEHYMSVSASWELGFNDYVIAVGSRDLNQADVVSDPNQIEELSEYLKAFDGEGELKDGTPVYRLVVGEVYPLGIGFTANPAAEVKGVYLHESKKKVIAEADDEDDYVEKIEVENKNYFKKYKKNISQNEILTVKQSINNISIMEKENLLEDIKALLEEKMPKHDFNQETVANIGRVIGDAIKSKSEQYEQEVKSMEEEKVRIAEAEVQMTQDIAELKDKLESAESQVSSLSDDIQARESEEKFNARMEQVDASYELGEEDRKVLASEVQELALEDEAFDAYSEKLAVMWAHKNKEYLAKQDELFKEKVEAEISKRLEGLETAKASNQVATTESTEEKEEAAEEVLEKAEAEEVVIVNNNSDTVTEEPSLRERFSQVFSKENLNIKF
jgi:hypothetical protein